MPPPTSRPLPPPPARSPAQRLFPAVLGAFLGLALLKFGNPPILEKFNQAPTDVYQLLFGFPWPIGWAYGMLLFVGFLGLIIAVNRYRSPRWLVFLPMMWLGWVFLSTITSVDHRLSEATLKHYTAVVGCFYLGYFALAGSRNLGWFWAFIFGGFFLVLATGWEQHFGGLEATRSYFFLYIYPQNPEVTPEYLKKITSTRIFGTLFYPNTLAGMLLLLLPACLALIWRAEKRFTPAARALLLGLAAAAALPCLFWSGSKGGWLLLLLLAGVALLRMQFSRKLKLIFVCATLALGLAGFFYQYAGFFQKGATSVVARFDYWDAAWKTALKHPLTGTGPGTFSVPYGAIKRPESEMARLTHNDYLEQATDSGFLAALLYLGFIVIGLVQSWRVARQDWVEFAVWLGLLGWALQSLIEFNLFIPALAWPAMALLGWMWARRDNALDKPTPEF